MLRRHVARLGWAATSTALAAALFATITLWRFLSQDAGSAVGALFAIPVALLAVRFGPRGGIASATLALAISSVWDITTDAELGGVGYLTRGLAFFGVGLLVGWQSEQRHRASDEAQRWFSMSNDLLCVAALDGRFTRVNRSWTTLLGYSGEELLDRPYIDFVHPDDVAATNAVSAKLTEPFLIVNFENRYRAKDGSWHWLLWSSRSDGEQVYAVAKDITDRKELEFEQERLVGKLESLARTDDLTGLPNRRAWKERLTLEVGRAARSNEPLILGMIDLDDFKEVNDTGGHAAGDALLEQASSGWRQAIRETDYLARVGGDEFGLVLPACKQGNEVRVIARMREAMPAGRRFSAGVATWDGREGVGSLLERADRALYEEKARREPRRNPRRASTSTSTAAAPS